MKPCRIVPAIDLINGRCVRLERGAFESAEVVGGDPVRVAASFEELGFGRLHVVDLDGAQTGASRHLEVIRAVTRATSLTVDVSGGIRTREDVERMLESGASQVVVGSMAVINPDEVIRWVDSFGGKSIIVGLDVLGDDVRIKGWQESGGTTVASVLARFQGTGLRRVMSTDISRDGMLQGPATQMYDILCREYPDYEFIASGGVSCAADVQGLGATGVKEIIVGKALYSGTLNVSEVREFLW